MSDRRLDDMARAMASGFSRRAVLAGLATAAFALGAVAPAAAKARTCRAAGDPCTEKLGCCGELVCAEIGIGAQRRCIEPLPPPPPPQ